MPWVNGTPGQDAPESWRDPGPPDGGAGRAGQRGRQDAARRPRRGRLTGQARTRLLAALADVGVEPDDYALIEDAKALVDEVNARLRARRSYMVYSVTFCAAPPPQPQPQPCGDPPPAQAAQAAPIGTRPLVNPVAGSSC